MVKLECFVKSTNNDRFAKFTINLQLYCKMPELEWLSIWRFCILVNNKAADIKVLNFTGENRLYTLLLILYR